MDFLDENKLYVKTLTDYKTRSYQKKERSYWDRGSGKPPVGHAPKLP